MQCVDCEWIKDLENSDGETIYFCVNTDSGAYLCETGICGHCNVDGEYD